MNQQEHIQTPEPDRPGGHRARSRRRWWAAGLAGVTGLALTAAGITVTPIGDAVGRAISSSDDRPGKHRGAPSAGGDHHDERAKGGGSAHDGRGKDTKGIPIPCDADKLIAAITLANARGGATLNLASKCTYLLTATIDDAGLPDITTPITLNGGKHTVIERAAAVEQFRILTVDTGGDLTLHHLTITGGQTDSDGGGILVNTGGALTTKHSTITRNIANGSGGGIYSAGVTTVRHTTVSRNTAVATGGGFLNSGGRLTLEKAVVKANTAGAVGGVVSIGSSAVVTIRHSLIADNNSGGAGGLLILNDGIGTVVDSTITGNRSSNFAGIQVDGQLTLKRVKITNNTASSGFAGGLFVGPDSTAVVEDGLIQGNTSLSSLGGGVYNFSVLVMRNTKVIGNQAEEGGGIYNSGGTVTLFNTQVVKNIATVDGGGIVNNGGTVDLNTATGTIVIKNRPNNCVGDVPDCPA
ncbi:right-handed parallel beta-helix repeat-containing protein [Salinispora pacifica]|uniref:right-handed parallel beta-helix repeat-containing protein n=1 Tax=Salinispora pacifica TaxID=351187 RepID=UPI000483591A|nr:right-handed parallel beta-helix repeat-containing protein [Salinispora pacifica]